MEKPSVAEQIVAGHLWVRSVQIISTSVFSILCAVFGFFLTWKGAAGAFTVSGQTKSFEGYFSSVAPGLFFVLAGAIAIWIVARQKKTVITQHKDEQNPGLTSAEH